MVAISLGKLRGTGKHLRIHNPGVSTHVPSSAVYPPTRLRALEAPPSLVASGLVPRLTLLSPGGAAPACSRAPEPISSNHGNSCAAAPWRKRVELQGPVHRVGGRPPVQHRGGRGPGRRAAAPA